MTRPLVDLTIALLLTFAGGSGCALFKDAYRVDPVVVTERSAFNEGADYVGTPFLQAYRALSGTPSFQAIVLREYHFPDQGGTGQPLAYSMATCGSPSADPAVDARCRDDRNRLAAQVVGLSNDMCVQHMSGFVSQQALNEIVLGGITLGLTGGGSVAASAATELAAAATGIGGLRSLVNDTVYYKQLTPSLVKRAVAERNRLLTRISAKLQVNSLDGGQVNDLRDACIADCSAGKRPGAPEGETPAGCRSRCKAQTVFPCPNVLQADLLEARREADDAEKKQSDAAKAVAKAAGTTAHEAAVKDKIAADDKKEKADEKKSEAEASVPYCRYWRDYPIDAVLADLKPFHDACSFYHALGIAADEIQKSADDINGDLDKIYKGATKAAAAGDKPAAAGDASKQDGKTAPAKGDDAADKKP